METGVNWSYDILKHMACEQNCCPRELVELKNIFTLSARQYDRIQSINDLLDCLETRDELSVYNIEALRELADHCGSAQLQQAIAAYQAPKEVTTAMPINQYQEIRLAEELRKGLNISEQGNSATNATGQTYNSQTNVSPNAAVGNAAVGKAAVAAPRLVLFTEQKRAAIYKKLSQELGTDWRNLGRELDIREGAMDEIEIQFPRDLKSRILRLLQLFEEDDCHDPKQHVLILCRALDECRRKDLRRKVEEIMSH